MLIRYKGLIPTEMNVPSEPTKDINPEPGLNEFLCSGSCLGFSILLGSAEHSGASSGWRDRDGMHCSKGPGAKRLPDTQQLLGRMFGNWLGRKAQRKWDYGSALHGAEHGLAPGRCVVPVEGWELLDIWSHHVFRGDINCQGVPKVFSSSIRLGRAWTAWLNTASRIVVVFQELYWC